MPLDNVVGDPGNPGFSGDGGQAQDALVDGPHGLFETAGNVLYFADTGNRRTRKAPPPEPTGLLSPAARDGDCTGVRHRGRRLAPNRRGPPQRRRLTARQRATKKRSSGYGWAAALRAAVSQNSRQATALPPLRRKICTHSLVNRLPVALTVPW